MLKAARIRDAGFFPEKIPDFGNKYLTGNGYLGVRGTLEEYGKEQMAAVNLSGIYDRKDGGWREPPNAPNPFFVRVKGNGVPYSLPERPPRFHMQKLNLNCGLQGRSTRWETPEGTFRIRSERFCSMADFHLLCLRYSVRTSFDAEIEIALGIDGDVWDIHGPHYAAVETGRSGGALKALAKMGSGVQVAVAQAAEYSFPAQETFEKANRRALRIIRFPARANRTFTVSALAAIYTSRDVENPLEAAVSACLSEKAGGYAEERRKTIAAWGRLWKHTRVTVDGDEAAQRALDYSVYQLHCVAPRYARGVSIPARGLSGQVYKGAVFWDTEMFLFDFFLYTEPAVARSLLQYRIDTLDGARRKAAEYGYRGAFYAWESQDGGCDACTDYNVTDVFTGRPVRTYFRDRQVHISSAVVYAVMKYVRATGDVSVLAEGAGEVVVECARFYRSLLLRRIDSDRYEIRDVLGPDEYHERVDNNAYTNRMARFVFSYAQEVIEILRKRFPPVFDDLNDRFGLDLEREKFRDSAEKTSLRPPREADGVIEQFDGYFHLEDTTPAVLAERLLDPREYWGGPCGVASQTQVIKQADVVLMLSLFGSDYPEEILKRNWRYYEPRTEHGSSLSACAYALLACRVGEADLAYPFFLRSAQTDLAGGGKQWAGSVYIGGTHPAAAGGAWMTAVEGFAGLCAGEGRPLFRPCLPKGWKRLRFFVRYRATLYSVDITPAGCSAEPVTG